MASARLMPIALTLMRTSFGPGAGTWTSANSRPSGPPAFANLIVRDMAVSAKLGFPGRLPIWREYSDFSGLPARETRGADDNRSVLYQRLPKLFGELTLARGDGRYAR